MKKAVVTGANGFVGSAVCKALSDHGIEVIAVIRNQSSDLSRIESIANIRIVYCESREYVNLSEMIPDKDLDCFYHFAWCGSAGIERADDSIQLGNVSDSIAAIRACKKMNCQRFIYAASVMEYEIEKAFKSDCELHLSSMYSTSKLFADYMLRITADELKIDYIRCVISNIFGPNETSPRLINSSLRKMLRGERCSFTSGEQLYDFIYITDAAEAFFHAGESGRNRKTYYIGNKKQRRLKDYLIEMRDIVDKDLEIGLGDVPFSGVSLAYDEFDTSELFNDTSFTPEISFEEGIRRTVNWIKGETYESV